MDRSSPDFGDQLNKALHGQEYARCVQNFQKDDLVWFVDYLDKARRHITLSHWTLKLASRLSIVSILRAPLPESVCVNSEAYAQHTRHSRHHIRFLPTFLPSIPIRLPLVALVRCILGPSITQRFVSNVCEWLLKMFSQWPLRCVMVIATLHMRPHT